MQPLAAPVRRREERHSDLLQIGRARAVILVIERVRECAGDDVASILFQLFWREGLGPSNRLAGDPAARPALPDAMLHRKNRTRIPVGDEFGIDAAMITGFAVVIRRALPSTDGGQVRWRQCSNLPCVHRKIGNAVEADLPGTPLLRGGPFYAFVKISGFSWRPRIDITWRAAGAARIDTHDCIAVRYPPLRVNDFPVLISVTRSYGDFRLLFDHPLPGEFPTILEGVALRIGPVIEDHRKFAVAHGVPRKRRDLQQSARRRCPVPCRSSHRGERTWFCRSGSREAQHWARRRRETSRPRCAPRPARCRCDVRKISAATGPARVARRTAN